MWAHSPFRATQPTTSTDRKQQPAFQKAVLKPTLTYASPSEDKDLFIQAPTSFDWSDDGTMYMLDSVAKTIWYWDAEGKFLGHFGRAGEGPGEFAFSKGRGVHRSQIQVIDDEVWIFDDGPHMFKIFSLSGKYRRQISPEFPQAHIQQAWITTSKKMIVLGKKDQRNPPHYLLGFCDQKGRNLETTFDLIMPMQPNRDDHFLLGFGHKPAIFVDLQREMIIFGSGEKPEFHILSASAKAPSKLSFPYRARKLTKADKNEFKAYEAANYDHTHPLEFPTHRPYYNSLVTFQQDFLIFALSPQYGHVDGVWLNAQGDIKGYLRTKLGEGGVLLAARSKLLQVSLDTNGDFQISQVHLEKAP